MPVAPLHCPKFESSPYVFIAGTTTICLSTVIELYFQTPSSIVTRNCNTHNEIPKTNTLTMKIAIAITGASGSIYAKVLLDMLQDLGNTVEEVAVVMSENAKFVWKHELGNEYYEKYPFRFWDKNDFLAPFASGSSSYQGLIICPCSMGTLGRIATGISNDLITRAADVMLKERRKLICVVRETPYNLIHLKGMTAVTEAGGIILPATPSFYSKPETIEEVAATVIQRAISLMGLPMNGYRWNEE